MQQMFLIEEEKSFKKNAFFFFGPFDVFNNGLFLANPWQLSAVNEDT